MNNFDLFAKNSLLFAPMEGVTDEAYRIALMKTFPEWDLFFTDFLRVPTTGKVNERLILDHYGKRIFENKNWRDKNSFQILTTHRAQTEAVVDIINDLNFKHLDLNLGCPSKKVNSHFGGAYLLSDLPALREILRKIRSRFKNHFTVKMRIGYRDDKMFVDTLKLIEDEGIEAITLHARTRDQLYQGVANWAYIKEAVSTVKIPVIGNGDIWNAYDIEDVFDQTKCHSIMFGRSALKTPWLAKIYKEYVKEGESIDETYQLYQRKAHLELYFEALLKEYRQENRADEVIHKRFKSFSLHLFDDYHNGEFIRGQFLRSTSLDQFMDLLYHLKG